MNSATSREIAAPPLNAYLSSPAEARAHLREDELVGERERRGARRARRRSPLRCFAARCERALDERSARTPGFVGDLLLHRRVELVEDARHAEEERRLHLGEVVEDLVDALADAPCDAPIEKQHVELARLAERVRPRAGTRASGPSARHREDVVHRADVRRDVPVREDDALRVARRAARVDEAARCPSRSGLIAGDVLVRRRGAPRTS